MDSNMTFRIDSEVKAQMAAICDALGMSTSTAFNIFDLTKKSRAVLSDSRSVLAAWPSCFVILSAV